MSVHTVAPAGYVHAAALAEVTETLEHGLRRADSDRTVIVGAHLQPGAVGVGTIIYNTEHAVSAWFTPAYQRMLCAAHEVWDYSAGNAAALSEFLGRSVRHVPLGYVPELTRIVPAVEQDIDVLFYGSMNERRVAVLDGLRQAGLAVEHVFGVYGEERDALIARAKVVLNMHFYLPGRFEIVRVSYLMANRKAVVTELNPGEEIDEDLREGLWPLPYEHLVRGCCHLIDGDAHRDLTEDLAFRAFAARDMVAILKDALSDRTVSLSNNLDTWQPASPHS